jgi:hypothetical protein
MKNEPLSQRPTKMRRVVDYRPADVKHAPSAPQPVCPRQINELLALAIVTIVFLFGLWGVLFAISGMLSNGK